MRRLFGSSKKIFFEKRFVALEEIPAPFYFPFAFTIFVKKGARLINNDTFTIFVCKKGSEVGK